MNANSVPESLKLPTFGQTPYEPWADAMFHPSRIEISWIEWLICSKTTPLDLLPDGVKKIKV